MLVKVAFILFWCHIPIPFTLCDVKESNPSQIREVIYVRMEHKLSREVVMEFNHAPIALSYRGYVSIHFCRLGGS